MDVLELFKQRYGLSHDPNWGKYHQWPWEYFPITLPACTVLKRQVDIERSDVAVITWEVEKGVPVVVRLDNLIGEVFAEVLPEPFEDIDEGLPPTEYIRGSKTLDLEGLSGSNGIAFEWVFEIPVKPVGTLQPFHPLGVVRVDGGQLAGKETIITVNAGGREKGREQFLMAQKSKR